MGSAKPACPDIEKAHLLKGLAVQYYKKILL
jgi:hypothetical protein